MEFDNTVVMITGAGSGIGKATALEFAQLGAYVCICDIDMKKAEQTAAEIEEGDGNAKAFYIDISDSGSVSEAIKEIRSDFGKIDTLVNAAGIIFIGKIEDVTDEAWDRVIDINLKGSFLCCREIIPVFKEQKKGCIINITAGAAKTGGMNVGANYVCSKAGLNVLTIHLARYLAPYRIRVNAISPGPIDTPMLTIRDNIEKATPLGLGKPEDIAKAAVFLASEEKAGYITGEILDVDGGLFMD